MYEFKVVITAHESVINDWLDKGWFISSVTAQHVAAGRGEFCFVLKK